MKKKRKLQLAKACHNIHNVVCLNNGMQVIPWEEKSEKHHKVVINSIDKILKGKINSPEESHDNFVAKKEKDGWIYGEKFSTKNKTNPRLCNFNELEGPEKEKEDFFFALVSSFKK